MIHVSGPRRNALKVWNGSGGEMYEKMYERHRENVLDQSLADTFPASDPVAVSFRERRN